MNCANKSANSGKWFSSYILVLAMGTLTFIPGIDSMEIKDQRTHLPAFKGKTWFNSQPLSEKDCQGRVVLIDFWEYTCINCLRTLPYIKEYNHRYADQGLLVIGVHTPEFPFARDPENVKHAVTKLGLTYPIVMDNDYTIWQTFANHYWPARYLFDNDGILRYYHFGEGGYSETEELIQKLLKEHNPNLNLPVLLESLREADRPGAVCYRVTPEIYCGYWRGRIGNQEGYHKNQVVNYKLPAFLKQDIFYAAGRWKNNEYALKHEPQNGEVGSILLKYVAAEINAVIRPESETGFKVFVKQNGKPVAQTDCGTDLKIDSAGQSYLVIDEPKMYNIVKNSHFGVNEIELFSTSPGLAIYSFTFVTCPVVK